MASYKLTTQHKSTLWYAKYRYKIALYQYLLLNNRNSYSRFYEWHFKFCISKDYKLTSDCNFYFNDLNLVSELPECLYSELTVIEVVGLKESTVYFKNPPKYKYKATMKHGNFSYDFLNYINGLNLQGLIDCSKDLHSYFNGTNRYGNWFYNPWIRFNDEGLFLILKLTYGEYVTKIYKLEQEPTDNRTLQLQLD
jgi:hypothetical protein